MTKSIVTTIRGTYCDKSARLICEVQLYQNCLVVREVELIELDHISKENGQCTVLELCPDDGLQRDRDHFKAVAQGILDSDRVQWDRIVQQIEQAAYENAQLDLAEQRNDLQRAI